MPVEHHQHFLLSAKARTISSDTPEEMSDEEIFTFFCQLRWPEERGVPTCPKCGSQALYNIPSRKQWRCKNCDKTFSLTSGTWLHSIKLPLRKIFKAIIYYVNAAKGIPALQQSRNLNIQYKTAYVLNQKIRAAILDDELTDMIDGDVEVDAFFVRTKTEEKQPNNKKSKKKTVLAIKERQTGSSQGSVITKPVPVESSEEVKNFLTEWVKMDSNVFTDSHKAYGSLEANYNLQQVNHSKKQYVSTNGAHTNNVESFFSRFRRGIIGQYHCLSEKHLPLYSQEMAFREETRRVDNGSVVSILLGKLLKQPHFPIFRGYWRCRSKVNVGFSSDLSAAA